MPRQGLTRRDVLQACFRLIDEKGFAGFSMHELARRLNIRTASLYNHIENESTLLLRIGQTATERFSKALTESIEGKKGEEALRALADAWWRFAGSHPGLYTVAMRAAEEKGAEEKPAFFLPVEALTEENGALRDLIISLLHGAVSLENAGIFPPEGKAERLEAVTNSLMDLWKKEGRKR